MEAYLPNNDNFMLQTNIANEEAQIQETVEETSEITTEETTNEELETSSNTEEIVTENKWSDKAKKLLSQRNEARREADELKQRLEKLESRFTAEDNAKVEKQQGNFEATYWADALEKAKEKQSAVPWLTLEEAHILNWWTVQKNPNRFAFSGRTPDSIKANKSISELSSEDLAQLAAEELKNNWFGL